jgi:hypothetical protein
MNVKGIVVAMAIIAPAAGCSNSASDRASSPGLTSTPGATSSSPSPSGAYHVSIDPANFTASVTNPWFPLVPGTTFVYEGVKDGKPLRDVFEVTHRTVTIEGVPCVVVKDQGFLDGVLSERTSDYYTQDLQGNVWYFGEDTAELSPSGEVKNTEGTWHAGVDGAQPGIYIDADPTVGATHRQEYYKGQAEDQYLVLSLSASITVPYGSFHDVVQTKEWTELEPRVIDHKYYVRGVGEVAEKSAAGPKEQALLVSITHA